MNYLGRKIKGFKFEHNTDTIVWNSKKEKYIGKIGLIVNQYTQFIKVKFDKRLVYYPISMIEEHLINEEKDSIVEAVRADLQRRSEIGIKKYNTTLDRTDLTEIDWLNHAYEEALDLALYLKKTITLKQESK